MTRQPLALSLLLSAAFSANAATRYDVPSSTSQMFAWADMNGDGRVSLGEYQHYMSRGFVAMDRNRDNVVDLNEFPVNTVGPNSHALTLSRHRDNLAAAFKRQDHDGDGYLNERELSAPPG